MLLAIDVGNTDVKLGLWEAGWTVTRRPSASILQSGMAPFLRESLAGRQIAAAIGCSVVPSLDASMRMAVKAVAGVDITVLSTTLPLGLDTSYRTPQTLGADRLANVLGALATRARPVIVVDFGTATKIEAVSASGIYLGGAIMPGLEGSAASLVKGTAKLQPVPLTAPEKAIGDSTATALQSGIVLGHIAAVDGLVERFRQEMGIPPQAVLATGGVAKTLASLCRCVSHVEPNLTLDGLREAASRLGLYAG